MVPETLEPSLQLAAAVLREMEFNADEARTGAGGGKGRRGEGRDREGRGEGGLRMRETRRCDEVRAHR